MSDLLVVQMSEIARIARWSREQAGVLPEAVRGDRFYAFYVLAVTAGMRNGELLALQWKDVDLEDRTLLVRRTVSCFVPSVPTSCLLLRRICGDLRNAGCGASRDGRGRRRSAGSSELTSRV